MVISLFDNTQSLELPGSELSFDDTVSYEAIIHRQHLVNEQVRLGDS